MRDVVHVSSGKIVAVIATCQGVQLGIADDRGSACVLLTSEEAKDVADKLMDRRIEFLDWKIPEKPYNQDKGR